jgi:hypothetical protein
MSRAMPHRLASIILLLGALGSFALGMVSIAFSPTLIADLQAIHQPLPAACVSNGIATYSGFALVAGASPSVDTACLHNIDDVGAAQVGIEPLSVAAGLVVVAIIVVNIGGWRGRRLASIAGPLVAIALLVSGALVFPGAFESHFGVTPGAVSGQPAIGLWVVCGLLLAVPVFDAVLAMVRWAQRSLAPL